MKKCPEISSFLKTLRCVEPRKQLSFEKILKGIKNCTLYGFLLVDIHTPDELKPKFADFLMIIKNAMISREDLSPYMLKIAEEQGCSKKHASISLAATLAKTINSEMAKFYLSMGLVITEVQKFVQFSPS